MSRTDVEFIVMGDPVPEGSVRGIPYQRKDNGRTGVNIIHNKSKELQEYRKKISTVADVFHDDMYSDNKDMGYEITMVFYIQKAETAKRPFPTVKAKGHGDIDKFTRSVLDALTANEKLKTKGVWADDSQVVRIKSTKYYTDAKHPHPMTFIKIRKVLLPNSMKVDESSFVLDDDV